MDQAFWQERWQTNNIGFHQSQVHPMLAAHIDRLSLPAGGRMFVPLCGKTLDIHWLLARGYRVVGAELSALAVTQLFAELGVTPEKTRMGPLERWSAGQLEVYVGDIFDLTSPLLGAVDAVYDRAALVALPPSMRGRYTAHLAALTEHAPQLLITFDYDQAAMDGPPFSVPADEVREHYARQFTVEIIDTRHVAGGLRGQTPATETLYLLTPQPLG